MAQLIRGHTFTEGSSGNTAANLNSLVDSAQLDVGAIDDQPNSAPATTSTFLHNRRPGILSQCTGTQLIAMFPQDAAASTKSMRSLGTGALQAAPGNDARFPARLTGIRKANGTAADTVATPLDLVFYHAQAHQPVIDWTNGNFFYETLDQNRSFSHTSSNAGKEIVVFVKLNGHTPTFTVNAGTITALGAGTTARIYRFQATPIGITGYYVAI